MLVISYTAATAKEPEIFAILLIIITPVKKSYELIIPSNLIVGSFCFFTVTELPEINTGWIKGISSEIVKVTDPPLVGVIITVPPTLA